MQLLHKEHPFKHWLTKYLSLTMHFTLRRQQWVAITKKPYIAHIAVKGKEIHTHTHTHTQSTCDVTEVVMEDMFVSCNLDQKVGL